MNELPRFGFDGSEPEDKEAGASEPEKKRKASKQKNAREIGAFAKRSLESTSVKSDRSEKSAASEQSKEKKAEASPDKPEKDDSRQRTELLQAELDRRIAGYDEVIETAAPGSAEHVQAVAAKELDAQVKEKAADPAIEHDPVIEAEYARQLAEIELPEEAPEADGAADLPEQVVELRAGPDEAALEASDDTDGSTAPTSSVPPVPPARAASPTGPPASPPRLPSPPAAAPPQPPRPPRPPFGNGGSTATIGPRPPAETPNVLSTPVPEASTERTKKARAFLAGGLLGYMVGRRGGRKRAERRLEPQIESLNSELETTKKHLDARERDIKTAATAKLREQQAEKYRQAKEKPAARPVTEILRQTIAAPEQVRTPAPVHQEVKPPASVIETKKPEPKPAAETTPELTKQRAEQLSTPALLKMAESLFVGGVSVKNLYEANRIDRQGLVEIVQEGLKGHNLTTVFERVELGRERQRERAREFRHDDPGFSAPPVSNPQPVAGQATPPAAASSPLPNTPDTTSLQPLSTTAAPVLPVLEAMPPEQPPHQPLNRFQLTFGAIAAVAIALLILWAILG